MHNLSKSVLSSAAAKCGISVKEYENKLKQGLKRCTYCRSWHPISEFGKDSSRGDGLSANCRTSLVAKTRKYYTPAKRYEFGYLVPARNNDKVQIGSRISNLIKRGILPRASLVPCSKCGHEGGDRKHDYHHSEGYGKLKQLTIVVLCRSCHGKEHWQGRKCMGKRDENGKFVRKN